MLLHKEQENQPTGQKSNEESCKQSVVSYCAKTEWNMDKSMETSSVTHYVQRQSMQVVLSTALVNVNDADGNRQVCRILFDPESQSNLIREDLVNRLKLKHKKQQRTLTGINRGHTTTCQEVNIKIKSIHTDLKDIRM